MTPLVYIIILNWNTRKETIKCIESANCVLYQNVKILIVDNGSDDGSAKEFRKRFPNIDIIENKKNLGYAGGNNVGIKKALNNKADYVFLVNSDVVIDPNCINELVKLAEQDFSIGIVGPKNYFFDKPNTICFAGGKINLFTGQSVHMGVCEKDKGQYDDIEDVDYITGSAIMIKSEVFEKIGLFDERFFAWYEDSDFCIRAKNSGFCVRLVPQARIWHKVSQSIGGHGAPLQTYYGIRNILLFMRKHGKCKHWFVFAPYYFYKYIARKSLSSLRQKKRSRLIYLKIIWRALVDSWFSRYGRAPAWIEELT